MVSISLPDFDPHEVAAILDQQFHVQVRAGLHCAPGAHASLGTLPTGGTLRFSPGPFTTVGDIDAAVEALRALQNA